MNAHIVYCHPSKTSCTHAVCEAFIRGVTDSGHTCTVSDLYALDFDGDITEAEYLRDANYRDTGECPPAIRAEQEKINNSDALVFVYPVFWTEAPAKLKGWFDRVWSFGFAYGENRRMKTLDTGLVLCCAGHSRETLEQFGYLESMKKVMLNDRLNDRARRRAFIVYDETSHEKITAEKQAQYVEDAYARGKSLFGGGKHVGQVPNAESSTSAYATAGSPPVDRAPVGSTTAVEPRSRNSPDGISLDGVFCLGPDAPVSVPISKFTVFSFRQKGTAVWAEYQGGGIQKGMLLGSMEENGAAVSGTWQHLTTDATHDTGSFSLTLSRNAAELLILSGTWHKTGDGKPVHLELSEATSEV